MKREDYIRDWLIKQRQTMRVQRLLRAAAAMGLSLVILFCTFWFFYYPVDFAVSQLWGHSVKISLLIGAGVFVLYVIASLMVRPAHMKRELHGSEPDEVGVVNVMEARLYATIISYGPHLFLETFRLIGEAGRLAAFDVDGCAPVLAVLSKADARLAYEEILPVIPTGHDANDVVEHLRLLDGVLFLKSDPPGLSLTSAFRKELRSLRPKKREA